MGAGASINAVDFDPFGNVVSHHNSTGYDGWQKTDFTGDNTGGNIQAYSKGYVNGLSGSQLLFYNDTSQGARQYDPQFNAWTSTDTIDSVSGDPTSELPYAYANNNPTAYSGSIRHVQRYRRAGLGHPLGRVWRRRLLRYVCRSRPKLQRLLSWAQL